MVQARMSLGFDPIEEARRQWELRWDASPAMAAVTSVIRTQQLVLSRINGILTRHGLTFARYEALVLLHFSRQGELPLGKMGERLMVHPTSVTNTIDHLERQGLVRRRPHPTDRRTTLAVITPDGVATMDRATKDLVEARFAVAELTDEQADELTGLLAILRRATGDPEA
jgi:DNA-binding MarR family transcriptional regulator